MEECAKKILADPIDVDKFNGHAFQKSFTDVIAIDRNLANKLKVRFMGASPSIIAVDDANGPNGSASDSSVIDDKKDHNGGIGSLFTGFKFGV